MTGAAGTTECAVCRSTGVVSRTRDVVTLSCVFARVPDSGAMRGEALKLLTTWTLSRAGVPRYTSELHVKAVPSASRPGAVAP